MQQQLAPPDTFRLRYRNELAAAVAAIVRGGLAADEAAVCKVLPATVADGDRARFVALTLAEFKTIHPGNAIRFGLRNSNKMTHETSLSFRQQMTQQAIMRKAS